MEVHESVLYCHLTKEIPFFDKKEMSSLNMVILYFNNGTNVFKSGPT